MRIRISLRNKWRRGIYFKSGIFFGVDFQNILDIIELIKG
jgi:hypothetical protein